MFVVWSSLQETDVVACENGTLALSGVSPASVSLAWTIDGNASLSKVDASTYKVIGGAGKLYG
jgi:hypothetical protein